MAVWLNIRGEILRSLLCRGDDFCSLKDMDTINRIHQAFYLFNFFACCGDVRIKGTVPRDFRPSVFS
jgi:hypothetical protein